MATAGLALVRDARRDYTRRVYFVPFHTNTLIIRQSTPEMERFKLIANEICKQTLRTILAESR